MVSPSISLRRVDRRPTITHPVLLDRVVAEDLGALFHIVDGLRVTEFKSLEVVVEHPPPTECIFGKLAASWIVGRPGEDSVSRIAVVIHLASLIALVLEFEPYGDVHGGRISLDPDHVVTAINAKWWEEGRGMRRKAKYSGAGPRIGSDHVVSFWTRLSAQLARQEFSGSSTWVMFIVTSILGQ